MVQTWDVSKTLRHLRSRFFLGNSPCVFFDPEPTKSAEASTLGKIDHLSVQMALLCEPEGRRHDRFPVVWDFLDTYLVIIPCRFAMAEVHFLTSGILPSTNLLILSMVRAKIIKILFQQLGRWRHWSICGYLQSTGLQILSVRSNGKWCRDASPVDSVDFLDSHVRLLEGTQSTQTGS